MRSFRHLDAPDPFITYVVGSEHRRRQRRAADERQARRALRRTIRRRTDRSLAA